MAAALSAYTQERVGSDELAVEQEEPRIDLAQLVIAAYVTLLLVAWWLTEANRTGLELADVNRAELAFRVVEILGLAKGSAYVAVKVFRSLP